jgi:hypothetical protein
VKLPRSESRIDEDEVEEEGKRSPRIIGLSLVVSR